MFQPIRADGRSQAHGPAGRCSVRPSGQVSLIAATPDGRTVVPDHGRGTPLPKLLPPEPGRLATVGTPSLLEWAPASFRGLHKIARGVNIWVKLHRLLRVRCRRTVKMVTLLACQVYDKVRKPTADRGKVEGVPTWSLVAAFSRSDGGFTVVY